LAKFEAILAGEKAMGVSAHNLGRSELAFGPEALRAAAARTGVPFISANAKSTDGKPLADRIRIVSLAGRRIAFVGVTSAAYSTDRITVDDPRQSAAAIAAERKADF